MTVSGDAQRDRCRCDGRYEGCTHGRTCGETAGATHSHLFCQPCDNRRRAHITARLEAIVRDFA